MIHFLFALICIVMPILGHIEVKDRRATYDDVAKEKTYLKVHLWYWIMTIAVLFFIPIQDIYILKYDFNLTWHLHLIAWLLIIYELLTSVLPVFLIKYSEQLRAKALENYDATKRAIYPVTERQQWRFLFVAVSVGIGEEVIFRGFLFNYLQDYLSISAWISFTIVTIYFALGHFHQGWGGIYNAFKLALIFGYLYFLTGSLLMPIIVHILYDMKIVWLARTLETHKGSPSI